MTKALSPSSGSHLALFLRIQSSHQRMSIYIPRLSAVPSSMRRVTTLHPRVLHPPLIKIKTPTWMMMLTPTLKHMFSPPLTIVAAIAQALAALPQRKENKRTLIILLLRYMDQHPFMTSLISYSYIPHCILLIHVQCA